MQVTDQARRAILMISQAARHVSFLLFLQPSGSQAAPHELTFSIIEDAFEMEMPH